MQRHPGVHSMRTQPDWPEQVRLAAPRGADVILEAVGGEMLHQSIGLLAPFGRAVVYGAAAGDRGRKSSAWSRAQSRKVRARAPVISSTACVTGSGWATRLAQ